MITREDAARVAALAKLDLTGEDLERARTELAAMLDYIAVLDAVDTTGVDTDGAVAAAPLRADEPRASLAAGDVFANAPDADRDAGLFRVPRVLGS
jgi:aspartyl-tRNA(Asn)/glutamyl-tRNA(Gln) amidotransferase subunit C